MAAATRARKIPPPLPSQKERIRGRSIVLVLYSERMYALVGLEQAGWRVSSLPYVGRKRQSEVEAKMVVVRGIVCRSTQQQQLHCALIELSARGWERRRNLGFCGKDPLLSRRMLLLLCAWHGV